MTMTPYFTITTNREVAESIEKVFRSRVLMTGRNLKLSGIRYEQGMTTEYAVVCIEPIEGGFDPEDLFWLGHYSGASIPSPHPLTFARP